jgi:DNA-binding CsgD family transcriptional regulator
MIGDAVSQTLDALYDAAVSPEHWSVAIGRLIDVFGCVNGFRVERDLQTMDGRMIGPRVDDEFRGRFFGVWRHRNIFANRMRGWQPGIYTDQQILPKSDLLRDDYFNGFMKRGGVHSLLLFSLRVDPGVHQSVSLTRPASAGEFETCDRELAEFFLPHLQRVAKITGYLDRSRLMLDAAARLLEENPTGILLLKRDGRIAFANRSARAMAEVADGFVLRSDRMKAPGQREDAILQRLIAAATGRGNPKGASRGGVMRLARRSGARDYVVVASTLSSAPATFEELAPAAFVLITDPDAAPLRSSSMLRRAYDLTATETMVAERLMLGDTPEQAAAVLEIKISTARTHLTALFRKTETTRQTELIRVLLSLPWMDEGMGT